MMALWKLFRAALPYLVAVAVVLGALFAAYRFGVSVENAQRRAEVADLKRTHTNDMTAMQLQHTGTLSAMNTAHQEALTVALQQVADAKDQAAKDMAALDLKYTKEIQDEKRKSVRDIAAVRSGELRLRERFSCPAPAPGRAAGAGGDAEQAAGASAGMGDGAAQRGFGAEDAAIALGLADEGDQWAVQLRACQAIIAKDRQ